MKVRLTAPARADLLAVTDWLAERSPSASDRALASIVGVIELLRDFPRLGMELPDGTREKGVHFGRDGYVIRYQVVDDALIVRRVFHTRQDR